MSNPQIIIRDACADKIKQLCRDGVEPLAARVLAARGIGRAVEIEPSLKLLPKPESLPGAMDTARKLAAAIKQKELIYVIGDYDADGMTATALAVDCLQKMGARVNWKIPSRLRDGYGLSPALVEAAAGARLLLTVDNGIGAFDGVVRAKEMGMTVCITDHHLSDGKLPPADCIVNPRVCGENFSAINLAGVGVAFYVMAALATVHAADLDNASATETESSESKKESPGVETESPGLETESSETESPLKKESSARVDIADYLDLVALGTIADCVELDFANRALVAAGIRRMRKNKSRPAVAALAAVARRSLSALTCRDISFAVAPRLNAAGRMDRVDLAMRCLLTSDIAESHRLAEQLDSLNTERIALQKHAAKIAREKADKKAAGITVFGADFHAGVVGIVAGELCAAHHRPAIVFSQTENGDWKGSGRAPDEWDLHAIVGRLKQQHPNCIIAFGGHARALGVAVDDKNRRRFGELFAAACESDKEKTPQLTVDGFSAGEITLAAVKQLEQIVWGTGFPEPRFAGEFNILKQRELRGGHLQMTLAMDGEQFSAVYFNAPPVAADKIRAVFSVSLNLYNGDSQLIIGSLLP